MRSLGKCLIIAVLMSTPLKAAEEKAAEEKAAGQKAAEDKPKADPMQLIKMNLKLKGGALPQRVIFISDLSSPKVPQMMSIDVEGFNKLSFVEILPPLDVKATVLINEKPWPDNRDEIRLNTLFTLLNPDMIIVGRHDGKPWRMYGMVNGNMRLISSTPGPYGFASDSRILLRWIFHSLGYDGVVTNVQGDRVTVVGIPGDIERSQGGRVIDHSTDRFVVDAGPGDVIAEIKLVRFNGALGEFQIQGSTKGRPPIQFGSKVIF